MEKWKGNDDIADITGTKIRDSTIQSTLSIPYIYIDIRMFIDLYLYFSLGKSSDKSKQNVTSYNNLIQK